MCGVDTTHRTLRCQPLDTTIGPCKMNGPVRGGTTGGARKCYRRSRSRYETGDRALKRLVRAAAALSELYDDTAIAEATGVNRGAVKGWWDGARMQPPTIQRLADATGLSAAELTSYLYFDGPLPRLPGECPPETLAEVIADVAEELRAARGMVPQQAVERLLDAVARIESQRQGDRQSEADRSSDPQPGNALSAPSRP